MVRLQPLWDCPKGSVNVFAEHQPALIRMAKAIESPNLMTQRYDADRRRTKTQTYRKLVWYVAVVGYRCTRYTVTAAWFRGDHEPWSACPFTDGRCSTGKFMERARAHTACARAWSANASSIRSA